MDKMLCLIVFGALAVTSMMQDATAQTVHVVGDNMGWIVPNGADTYTSWSAGKTFRVGDTLVFNFTTGRHDVQKVEKTSFDGCNSQNAIGDAIMTGPANVTLDSAGDHYFICTFGTHCQNGQKLAVTVSSTTGTPGANPPTSSASGPSGTVPGGIVPPPPSSSTTVLASVVLSLCAVVLAIFL